MTGWTSRGVGQYSPTTDASGGHTFLAPKNYRPDGTVRGVIYAHGATYNDTLAIDIVNNPNLYAVMAAVAQVYPVLSCNLGGDKWGNDTAITLMGDAKTYLQGTFGAKSGTVLLIGDSMGNLACMNWARANLASVAAIAGIIPVSDLNDVVTNNRGGFAASVNTAYSTYNNGTMGPTHNPTSYAAADLPSIATRLYYATDDAVCPASTVTGLATLLGANASAVSIGTGGHSDTPLANLSTANLLAFLAAHA